MPVNNVTRMLDSKKIAYTAFELPVEKLGALETAALLGVSPRLVYKSIIIKREKPGKPVIAVIPGDTGVDLKKLAAGLKEKKLILATQNEAEQLTGLLTGGISPLALINHGFTVVIDTSALTCGEIFISGGQRGMNIRLASEQLIKLVNARVADITLNL